MTSINQLEYEEAIETFNAEPWAQQLDLQWEKWFEQREPSIEDRVIQVNLGSRDQPKAIYKRYSLEAIGVVNHDVSDGQWELVFRACCIKIAIVSTDPDFFILFKNGDNVSNPIQMLPSRMKPH